MLVSFFVDEVAKSGFFDKDRIYAIKQLEGESLITVGSWERDEPPDEDGFGEEEFERWWFLDDNMQPIPGVDSIEASWRERQQASYLRLRAKAVKTLKKRTQTTTRT